MKHNLSLVLFLYGLGCACARPATYPAYCTDEKLFTAALARCVDRAASRPESRSCRKEVHAACGLVETSARSAP